MGRIGFYRHERVDGGIRTGIAINDDAALETYDAAPDEWNPALLWYLDLDIQGDDLPTSAEDVRNWCLKHAKVIQDVLSQVEEDVSLGFDVDVRPYLREFKAALPGVTIKIRLSAIHRLAAREVAPKAAAVRSKWRSIVKRLERLASCLP